MNLDITLGELLANPAAKAVLAREFPGMVNSPLIKLYSRKSVAQVLKLAQGKVPAEKLNRIIDELKKL